MKARPELWGVVNVTPDSFSDGGKYLDADAAVSQGLALLAAGASVVDVGAESTRPGAVRVQVPEEIDRLTPVVSALVGNGVVVSVDTMNAETAAQMVALGAAVINDVSGGLADPEMLSVMAHSGARVVLMHWKGPSERMDELARYDDVVSEVVHHLHTRAEAAISAGVDRERIVLDPGFGFSKTADHNWELCRGIDRVVELGFPVLAGVSRKRFVAGLLPEDHQMPDRDAPSAMVGAMLAARGVSALRVHDPLTQSWALEVWERAGGWHA